jgi:hypothetical protein
LVLTRGTRLFGMLMPNVLYRVRRCCSKI